MTDNTRDLDYVEADALVRALLAAMFRSSPKKVEQLAEEMSARLKRQITASMLRQFAAPTKETARFPLLLLPALIDATGDFRLHVFALGREGQRMFQLGQAAAAILTDAAQLELLARINK